jgi:subtilisin family serine protease
MNRKALPLIFGLTTLAIFLFSGMTASQQPENQPKVAGDKIFLILPSGSGQENIVEQIGIDGLTILRKQSPFPIGGKNLCEGEFVLLQYKDGKISDELYRRIVNKIDGLIKIDRDFGANPNSVWKPAESDISLNTELGADSEITTQFRQVKSLVQSVKFQEKLREVKIAVLDTGISLNHPSFKDPKHSMIVSGFNYAFPLKENGDSDTDPSHYDPNDYKDGFPSHAIRDIDTDTVSSKVLGHGTGVTSIIAGSSQNDNYNFLGVAAGAQILPIKVCDDAGACDAFQITAGICQAIAQKVDVINLSLSGPAHCPFISEALKLAVQRGITIVTAAGNYKVDMVGNDLKVTVVGEDQKITLLDRGLVPNQPRFPVNYGTPLNSGVIGVGAADSLGMGMAPFSRRTKGVRVIAPGTNVRVASVLEGERPAFTEASGTSYAAAWVSGLAALLKAQDPNRSPEYIVKRIRDTATELPCSSNPDDCGSGMINFAKALGVN